MPASDPPRPATASPEFHQRSRRAPALRVAVVGAVAAAVALSACSRSHAPRSLDEIRRSGRLVILTRNAPTTYYEGRDTLEGVEYEMAADFARSLGVKPKFVVEHSVSEILADLLAGKADMAAAGLTRTAARADTFLFGPTYQHVRQQVVVRRGGPRPHRVGDLVGLDLRVVANSSYVERLEDLRADHPGLSWSEDADDGTEQLLGQVWNKEIDCTIADNNIVAINRRYFPELKVAFDISRPQPLAWPMPRGADSLQQAAEAWFADYGEERLDALMEKYYGYVKIFDWVDTRDFVERIDTRLPHYEPLFRKAARRYRIPWLLLAAVSYQESHWRPHAESPTGVKGMMMLTLAAARDVGVADRLDPSQSILGGARYLRGILDRLPEAIDGQDRLLIGLAAYNVGIEHLRDARRLARRQGKDPDRWSDLADVLPLLARKQYYQELPHGYARGMEPVFYVNRIRHYEDVLAHELGR